MQRLFFGAIKPFCGSIRFDEICAKMGVRVLGYNLPTWVVVVALAYTTIQFFGAIAAIFVVWRRKRVEAKKKSALAD